MANIVFAGTPHFALPCLEALYQSPHQLKAIYTQPDRPAGRGRKLQPSAVKAWAEPHNLPIMQPVNFKQPEAINQLAEFAPDIMVVIAYGLILPQAVLDIPHYGCINVHASLLPAWRGASPIQHAILHGDQESGVTIMQMNAGMDTGGMYTQVKCSIAHNDTAGDLHDRLANLSAQPLLATIDAIINQHATPIPQLDELATYAPKIAKQDAAIDWNQPAIKIDCQIRAFNPWPIAFTTANETIMRIQHAHVVDTHHATQPGEILKITKEGIIVAARKQAIAIKSLQFPGGKALTVADYLNANRQQLTVGMVLK